MFRFLLSSAAVFALAQPVLAQSVDVTGGVELEFVFDDNNDSTQALIGYVEAESNGLYAGIWAQIANIDDYNEVDLYFGYRGETGQLAYDVYYTRYFFPNAGGDCCGDITLELDYALNEQFSLGTELSYDPESKGHGAFLVGGVAVTDQISFEGKYGYFDVDSFRSNEWEIEASYAVTEATSVTLTYADGEHYDPYYKLNLAWDFNILSR